MQDLKSFLNSNLKNAPVLFNKILLPVHTINYMFFFFFYISGDGDDNSSDDDDDFSLSDQEGSDSGGDAVSLLL